MVKRKSTKIVSMLLAVVMILGALPMSAFAAPNSDIPSDMLDNKYLDALAYTGYDVQAQKNDGSIFVTYGSRVSASIRSNITYDTGPSGLETISKSGTATGLAPNIAKYESSGLCCASYVSYVYYNYLPNIAGVDTSTSPCPSNPRSANAYNEQANSWIANGTARRISFTQASNGDNFNPSEEIPIGSLIVFEHDMGQIHMRWENGSSLALSIEEDSFNKIEPPEKISVLLVEPNKYPRMIEIDDTLESMQKVVGGGIEEYMPFDDEIAIICNDESKYNGMLPNRAIYSDDKEMQDIIFGQFFVCYAPIESEKFMSLPEDLAKKYEEKFKNPERFFRKDNEIVAVPFKPKTKEHER